MSVNLNASQIEALKVWLQANKTAPGWLDGYGLGQSYIDTRVSKGASRDGRKAYVKLDHNTATLVPDLVGLHSYEIREILEAHGNLT
jgi:hypothetical protein